ncbi:MAG TPA: hypothetical protein VK498_02105 [Ferruginibacter sp.]|nr:hypothetical protein [Ferruginibacter sp.]
MRRIIFFLLIFFAARITANAQNVPLKTYRIAIFAPLYLDSVFTDEDYQYNKRFPRFISPGLDFVNGAMIALDSIPVQNGNIIADIFDSKSFTNPVPALINSKKLDSLDLIIGSVKDSEYIQLANFAKQKNIPFISATYPNDGGIVSNPFLVIVNSTLKAHCEAIYSYILQNHATDKIILCRKPGSQENKVAEFFKKINEPDGKPLLSIQTINIINNDFSVIKNKLDSNRNTIIIGGSLDEFFATRIAIICSTLNKTYPITLLGMPNWDGFSSLMKKNSVADFPVFYTSPYYNYKWDGQSKMIQNIYLKKYKGIPSDMTYKGFETVLLFSRLLTMYPDDFMSHLNDYKTKVFNDYQFKPVFNIKSSSTPDYFENKRLYFLKIINGTVARAW